MRALRSFFHDVWRGLTTEPLLYLVVLEAILLVALIFAIWTPR